MKPDRKFYTPEIEEFHIGFECERNRGYGWEQLQILTRNMIPYDSDLEKYRVKCLDLEDIEGLGFDNNGIDQYQKYMTFLKNNGIVDIFMMWWYEKGQTSIQVRIEGMLDKDIDSLYVRNKSELVRILKQIGV